jgi:chromosome partitioning protein
VRTIAILNQKGGSGKTTTAVNLAAALGESGQRTLLIDMDPAASASSWLGQKDPEKGLFDVLTDGRQLAELIREAVQPGLDMIPSSLGLAAAEKALVNEIAPETLLKRRMGKLPQDKWDYLIVDCSPSMGMLTLNVLAASREVLIPVEAHILAVTGLVQLMQTVEVVRERLNENLSICGVLPCRVDSRTNHSQEVVSILKEKFGPLLFKTHVRENVKLAECPSFSKPITQYASSSTGAEDYRALAKEIVSREKKNDR